MKYQYAPLLQKTYPTIDQALSAIRMADIEDPKLRDIRPLMAILMRIATASPRLSGHIMTRKTAITSYKWTISGETAESEKVEERLRPVISRILEYAAQAPMFGAALFELAWDLTGSGIAPALVKSYEPTELEKNGTTVDVITTGMNSAATRQTVEPSPQFIVDVDTSYWLGGVLRSVMFHEILRNETVQEWATYNRKLKGIIQGILTSSATETDQQTAASTLQNIVQHNYAITSDAVKFQLSEVVNAAHGRSFAEFKDMLENDIAIAILGQANTAQLPEGGGSRAALQVLNMIRADIHYSDMNRVLNLMNNQLLKYDYQLNVNPNAVSAPYQFEFVYDEIQDTEQNARTIEIFARSGIPMLTKDMYEKAGMEVPPGSPDVFTPPQRSLVI